MNKNIVLFLMAVFSAFSSSLLASESETRPPKVYEVKNNELVKISLSSVDLNRIVILNDKVSEINCPAGFCTLSKERDSSGGTLLSIGASAQMTQNGYEFPPFTMFIETENGRHFSALVIPMAKPAVTAIFNIEENKLEAIEKKRKAMPYVSMLTSFMKESVFAFENNTTMPDFKKYDVSKDYQICSKGKKGAECINPNKVNALPMTVFHGGDYNIIVYKLYNPTQKDAVIKRSEFYVRGLAALTIEPAIKRLPAGGFAYMYQIVDGSGTASRGIYE
ncbi:TraK domain-containing protein [Vibrio furnissii]|uniref:TraK domain-containing protein n=1 Tax=Vibrio furnissii TaxID=29494 RepID=UPI001EECA497|nr:type-F conjugative transfer system secretin TraK [Vibrio furnissii]